MLTFGSVPWTYADFEFSDSVTFDDINASTATAAPISGSCETEGDTVNISIHGAIDGSETSIGASTQCTGDLTWSTTINVSSLDDGLLVAFIEDDPDGVPALKDVTPPIVLNVLVGYLYFEGTEEPAEGYEFASSTPDFVFSSDDLVAVECWINDDEPVDCTDTFAHTSPTELPSGPHIFYISGLDEAGNQMDTPHATNFCINTCEEDEGGGEGDGDPETETIFLAIRDGATLIGPVELELPAADAPDVSIAPTGTTTTYNVPARSVLALLTTFDAATTTFEITDLAYFTSFSSFLVNCISIPAVSEESDECFSWTYAVNGEFPSFGMDMTELADGDVAYVFFGSAWQVSVSDTSVETDEEFTATVARYDAETDTYVPAEGEIVGAVQFDDFFTPTEFATSTTDVDGEAVLSVADAGEYFVGAQSVFYFPNVTITVSEPEESEETPSGGGGGGGGGISHLTFNVPAALAYLASQQSADGSFGASLFSDWVALAFAAQDPGSAKASLRAHLLSATPAMTKVEDYERHAMALMALGINPYSGTGVDYISPIVAAFDGTQIGESIVHDDIFAVFPLLKAGYSTSDDIIQKAVAYIVSKQVGGSWGDPDTTAAAVQALAQVSSLPGVPAALTSAESYLRAQQQNNGGFGNSFSTGWVMQAIAALGQSETQWAPGGLYPQDYLATLQQSDGGVEIATTNQNTRVWATAYAIPGALGKTWSSLLSSFSRPTASVTGGGGSFATSTATTTPVVATTTAPIATSTPPQGEVLSQIIEEVADESPEVAFETRIAQVTESEPDAPVVPEEDATSTDQALDQLAAAAIVSGTNWTLIVLAFLALILFGIVGYVAFVRKYWN